MKTRLFNFEKFSTSTLLQMREHETSGIGVQFMQEMDTLFLNCFHT